jgi:hypothetical protein
MKPRSHALRFLLALGLVAGFVTACAGQNRSTGPTIDPVLTYLAVTQTAQEEISYQTEQAIANATPLPPSNTPRPTNTPLVIMTDTPTPSNTPLPTLTPRISNTPTQQISQLYFKDDFEQFKGWPEVQKQGYSMGYDSGGYLFVVNIDTGDSPIYATRGEVYKDIAVASDVLQNKGDEDNYFGLICRFKDGNNYYRFLASRNGYYEIGKKVGGVVTKLKWDTNGPTFPEVSTHRLTAVCKGTTLTFLIDGKQLAEVKDTSLTQGQAGLLAGTHSAKGWEVLYDNFEVSEP